MSNKNIEENTSAALRKKAESLAQSNVDWLKQINPEDLSPLDLRSSLHELHIHQIELEMQNEELRRSHVELDTARARYFDLFDLAPVGYFTIDDKGQVLEANLTAAKLLGLARAELVGQPFAHFIAYDDQDSYYLHRKKLFETGEHQSCELRMNRKNGGAVLWVQMEASLVTSQDNQKVCRVVSTEISTLKATQAALDRKLEEQRMLLSETHHRIKNNIVSIISLLSMQRRETVHPEALASLKETIGRLELMAELYEKMLLAGREAKLDLGSYLGDLADSVIKLYSNNIEISIEKRFVPIKLESDTVFSLGIILNELLTNTMKYAFEDREKGHIRLFSTQTEGKLTLVLHDDGKGLLDGRKAKPKGGFGLRLVNMLAEQLDACLTIETSDGTLCTLVIPV